MQLRNDWQRFVDAGVGVVAIGQGSAARTKAYEQELELPFPLLADPRRSAYQAYGLTHASLRAELNIGALGRHVRNIATYGGAREAEQDMGQLGGVFVVDTAGTIRYARPQHSMSDVPPNDELLAAAR